MMPRLLTRFTAAALLLLATAVATGASAAPYDAVLVAGDRAQRVFDNAIDMVARWVASWGVPASDIHRLSATPRPNDPSVALATGQRILQQIAALHPNAGGRCFVYVTSHGSQGAGVYLAAGNQVLRPPPLAKALAAGCRAAPTVVIISACYSGIFTTGAMQAPNRIILTAARADRPSFGCQADRTYTVFDECLLTALPRAATWHAVFDATASCVREHEEMMRITAPSEPQAFFGAAAGNLSVR